MGFSTRNGYRALVENVISDKGFLKIRIFWKKVSPVQIINKNKEFLEEGVPSSQKSLFLRIYCIGGTLFPKIFISKNLLYCGHPLPKTPYS
ncbi:MAG: hypothetical protein GX556_05515 [Fibrobacter sp.]|nr:hypothetical protein [Fibrobacter sp.]